MEAEAREEDVRDRVDELDARRRWLLGELVRLADEIGAIASQAGTYEAPHIGPDAGGDGQAEHHEESQEG
jgi:hypothetical protein